VALPPEKMEDENLTFVPDRKPFISRETFNHAAETASAEKAGCETACVSRNAGREAARGHDAVSACSQTRDASVSMPAGEAKPAVAPVISMSKTPVYVMRVDEKLSRLKS